MFEPTWRRAALALAAMAIAAAAYLVSQHGGQAQAAPAPAPAQLLQQAFGAASASLQREFARSTDWRAFVLRAVQHPGEGGHFYARHVLEQCERDRAGQDALARARCASFAPGEAAHLLAGLAAPGADSRDPLAETEQRILASQDDPEALRSGVERLLLLADPLLLSRGDLLVRIAASDPEARARGGLYLDGRVVVPASGKAYRTAQWALRLGACSEDSACALDEQVRAGCAALSGCDLDRTAHVRAQLRAEGGDEEDVATVLALAGRVRSAVSNQAVSFFVR